MVSRGFGPAGGGGADGVAVGKGCDFADGWEGVLGIEGANLGGELSRMVSSASSASASSDISSLSSVTSAFGDIIG